jgi:hypothetical protein
MVFVFLFMNVSSMAIDDHNWLKRILNVFEPLDGLRMLIMYALSKLHAGHSPEFTKCEIIYILAMRPGRFWLLETRSLTEGFIPWIGKLERIVRIP